MKRLQLSVLILCLPGCNSLQAQFYKPVQWHFSATPGNGSEVQLIFNATLEKGWHIYSQYIGSDGPLPTTFSFAPSTDYTQIGKIEEKGTPVKSYDKTFLMDIVWFANSVTFIQKIQLKVPLTTIQGKVEFMVCRDEMCLPPEVVAFSMEVRSRESKDPKRN